MKQFVLSSSAINSQPSTAGWPILFKLRQLRIHVVPRLRIGRPNFVLRSIHTRIVESPSGDALSEIRLAAEESGTAVRTEAPLIVADHFTRGAVIFRRTFCNLECFRRHVENRSVRAAARFLTIAA